MTPKEAVIAIGKAELWRQVPDGTTTIAAALLEAAEALDDVMDTEYMLSVSGHDVECDVVQTSGLPCSCGFSAARRKARAALEKLR